MVNSFQIASIAAVAATAFAYKSEKYNVGSCNTGKIHCCSTDKDAQESTGKNDALISTGDIISQLSLNCDQIPLLIGIAIEDECKSTPSCCEDAKSDSPISLTCNPLPLI